MDDPAEPPLRMRHGPGGTRGGDSSGSLAVLAVALVAAACSATGLHVPTPSDASTEPLDGGSPDAPPEPEPMPIAECTLDAPTSTVAGETPTGFLQFHFGWAGHYEACSGPHLSLGGDPQLSTHRAGWMVPPWLLLGPLGYEAGEAEIDVALDAGDGDVHRTRGMISITTIHEHPGDNPRGAPPRPDGFCRCDGSREGCEVSPDRRYIEAELRVDEPGWDLRGAIRAPYCSLMHAICF